MQNTIILLIEQIVVALGGEFKLYLPQLIPHMLRVFMHDNSTGRSVTIKVSALPLQLNGQKHLILLFNYAHIRLKQWLCNPLVFLLCCVYAIKLQLPVSPYLLFYFSEVETSPVPHGDLI